MFTGMMWFDNDPKKTLQTKVIEAATYYRNKYGNTPDLCLVNPRACDIGNVGRVEVRPVRYVMPGHLWIGIEAHDEPAKSA